MDDMKQLIEKYKRELMEYSKTAAPPKEKLEFPEMTLNVQEQPNEEQEISEAVQQPSVIGYSDSGELSDSFGKVFAELYEKTQPTEPPEEIQQDIAEQKIDDVEGVSTVTPETAERLDDVPQSGGDEDEQLGRRDFSEDQPQVNSSDDIAELEQEGDEFVIPAEQEYTSLQEYTDINNRRGMLQFRAYTARGALPVMGARIIVSKDIGGKKHVFYSLTTNDSGLTQVSSLPAPPKELSETPDSPVQPYALYDAEITAAGYNEVVIRDLPVFEGVLSVQRVPLVPDLGQDADVIVEQEPALNGGA
ncbi:MAG: hypothetical protein IJZ47_09825 [Oscillospiraceae bacterium]|nr:hypothetical protein [Oscillospiraceae bacterium]